MNLFSLFVDQISHLRSACAVALAHGTRDGDFFRIHVNLIDNIMSPLQALGIDMKDVKLFRAEGDRLVSNDKPGTIAEMVRRWSQVETQLSGIRELFHPDMPVENLKAAVESLLEVQAHAIRMSPHSLSGELQEALIRSTVALSYSSPPKAESAEAP